MATLVLLVGTSEKKKIPYPMTSRGLIDIVMRCRKKKKRRYKNDKTAASKRTHGTSKNLKGLLFAPSTVTYAFIVCSRPDSIRAHYRL